MIHRATWVAASVLAVVLVGGGIGYWGYGQQQQKESFARQAESQYSSAFHNLVNDVRDMRSEIAKTMLTRDPHSFQSHLSDVSRLSYAAQSDLGRLPADVAPSGNMQDYLHNVSNHVHTWISHDDGPSDKAVTKDLSTYYDQSGKVLSQLQQVQGQLRGRVMAWVDRNKGQQGAAVMDGMHKADGTAASFADKPNADPPKPTQAGNQNLAKKPLLTEQQAIAKVKSFMGTSNASGWSGKLYRKGQPSAYYELKATQGNHTISAEVTQRGGEVLTYYNDRAVARSDYDYAQAAAKAKSWLQKHGFANVSLEDSTQFDHTAMFTFAPTYKGVPVVSQNIQVHIALDNGKITGYNASSVYEHPLTNVAARELTVAQLRAKLSPNFQVRMEKPVIVENENKQYVPAVAFYGTMKDDTFCTILDARDGAEVKVDQLT